MADATPVVNGKSPNDAQPSIGHNGGPEIYVREIKKLTAIEAVLKNPKFNQTQALILIGLIVRSDEAYKNAFPGATTLALYAKVNRTQTVFAALKDLEETFKLIKRESRGQGRSNSYNVLPDRIMDAVVQAHEERKAAKQAEKETQVAERTEKEKPSAPTAPGRQTDRAAERTPTRCVQRTTDPVTYPVEKKEPESSGSNFWKNALGPPSDVLVEGGKVTLVNGFRIRWLEEFGGSEKDLNLALLQAAPYIQPNSNRTLEVQVSSQLARIVREKRDKDARYAAASGKPAKSAKPFKPSRW